jgi:hypothetical protein
MIHITYVLSVMSLGHQTKRYRAWNKLHGITLRMDEHQVIYSEHSNLSPIDTFFDPPNNKHAVAFLDIRMARNWSTNHWAKFGKEQSSSAVHRHRLGSWSPPVALGSSSSALTPHRRSIRDAVAAEKNSDYGIGEKRVKRLGKVLKATRRAGRRRKQRDGGAGNTGMAADKGGPRRKNWEILAGT